MRIKCFRCDDRLVRNDQKTICCQCLDDDKKHNELLDVLKKRGRKRDHIMENKIKSFEEFSGTKRGYFNKTCRLCWDKLPKMLKELQHYHDSSAGLWCTDKPEAIPEEKKHLFFQLEGIRDEK